MRLRSRRGTHMIDAAKLVRDHWSGMAKNPLKDFSWTDTPTVRDWVRRAVSGDPKVGWAEYAARKYLTAEGQSAAQGLVLGCGTGQPERDLRKLGLVQHIDAYDIAPGAV